VRRSREAHVPAQQSQAEEEARLPQSHAHPRWSRGAPQPPPARSQASQRLTWRIRDRATFEALSGTRWIRRGPLSLRYVPDADGSRARVAYSVARVRGSAVRRNRIRRRLRAAVRAAEARGDLASGAYLVAAGPEVLTMPFAALEQALTELLTSARGAGS
jgi:ribonuclease P protein component